MRVAAIGRWLAVVVAALSLVGCLPAHKAGISIEFGMAPREFEGLEVEIDGRVVGRLERFGQSTRTRFEVDKGEHTVRVLHPDYDCLPARVSVENVALSTTLMLDFAERASDGGRGTETVLVLGF